MKSMSFDKNELLSVQTDGSEQLSENRYNLIFCGTLLWGFLVNYILVMVLQKPLTVMLYRNAKSAGGIMVGVLIGYLVLCFCGSRLLRSETAGMNFLGFNLIAVPVGILVAVALTAYAGQPAVVRNALMLTMGITLVMMTLSMVFPQFFLGLGRVLGMSLIAVLVVELIGLIFFPRIFTVTDYIVAGLMCLYIGFDWGRFSTSPRTARNAIAIAASLYLDIVNLFLRLLAILGKKRD